ncbi:MAG: 3'-5' exoribonuclease [candidate division Zixibacteria bacterium]|nr:3'-5' exoribonuclease [candidate division Zixibacteria bacterium]
MDPDSLLSDFIRRQTLVAFDTETTGLWAVSNSIVEIAAVKFQPGAPQIEVFQSLVNPQRLIPDEVIEIHGITQEMVKDAPTAGSVLEEFLQFVGDDSILVAHNAPFDISFIGEELRRAKLDLPDNLILDTVDIYHRLFPGLPSYSLLNLVSQFGLATSQDHRALADAELVRRLFEMAAPKMTEIGSRDEIESHLAVYRMTDFETQAAELPKEHSVLNDAIRHGWRVEIEYRHPTRGLDTRTIRPERSYQLGPVHYINAWCERASAQRTFRLDRVESYSVITENSSDSTPNQP